MKRDLIAMCGLLMFVCLTAENTNTVFDSIVQEKGQKIEQGLVKQPVKIAFATPLKQVSDYWRRSIDSFKARMDELGIACEISEFSTKSDENRKLKECIQLALNTKPDYLVLTPNASEDNVIISRLLSQGDVKIIVQNVTIPNKSWVENPPFLYVGFAHKIGTEKIAEKYLDIFEKKKAVKYAVLYHVIGNHVSKYRGDYFNEILSKHPKFKLVREFYTAGNREKTKEATLKILADHPDIDFIYACATDIAFGVLDALKGKGSAHKVIVNGWGGGSEELNSILDKELDFTVMRMNDDNGVAMAEAIRLDLEKKKVPEIYSGKMQIVDHEMSPADIDILKKRAFRYSGY